MTVARLFTEQPAPAIPISKGLRRLPFHSKSPGTGPLLAATLLAAPLLLFDFFTILSRGFECVNN